MLDEFVLNADTTEEVLPLPTILPILSAPPIPARKITERSAFEKADKRVRRKLYKYIEKLEELAMGVLIQKEDKKTGLPTIYKVAPSREALQYLIDRGLGRIPQRFEMSGNDGGPLEIVPWAGPPNTTNAAS